MVSTAQLKAAGLGKGAIGWKVTQGWLHPLYRGVYACSPAPLSFRGHCWAAVLACGGPDAAALSFRTSAALDDLMSTPSGRIDVTTLRRSASMPGIRVHLSRTLTEADIVRDDDGLSRTTVARTLTDLATVLSPHQLRRVCHRAEHLRLIDMTAIATQRPSRKLSAALQRARRPQARRSPAASWRSASSLSSTPTRCRGRSSTAASTATRWTSTGPSTS